MLENINNVDAGVIKRWIYSNKVDYELVCDYLQKINYSIQDYNNLFSKELGRGDVCYLILLVTWIQESYKQIEKTVRKDVMAAFEYSGESLVILCNKYLRALRSFVVAHPLSTSKHSKYGLDGNYVCIDIVVGQRDMTLRVFKPSESFYYLSLNGLEKVNSIADYDYILYVYSKKENAEFFKYFGCNFTDLEIVAKAYIDKLKALDKYLARQKKKDYV